MGSKKLIIIVEETDQVKFQEKLEARLVNGCKIKGSNVYLNESGKKTYYALLVQPS